MRALSDSHDKEEGQHPRRGPTVRRPSSPTRATASLAMPELRALRELRRALARGGLPSMDRRTPEDHARIASFRALEELLQLLDQYRKRVEGGETCRLVEREQARAPGRLHLEIAIETVRP